MHGLHVRTPAAQMNTPHPPLHQRVHPVAHYWSGDAIRSRSVRETVLWGRVDVPAPPARLRADWKNEISLRLNLASGDVETLPLARARTRWPDFNPCVQAVADWTRAMGLKEVLTTSDIALMTTLGTKYHHDAEHYGGMAFCNLFLSEDCGLDVHFPATGHRIPLTRGTVVIFDTGQPHAVVERHSTGEQAQPHLPGQDRAQIFLTWELPIENVDVGRALGIVLDTAPASALGLDEEQVWMNGARVSVCPDTGRWRPTAQGIAA